MTFLIALVLATIFIAACGDWLRKHPIPYYLAAAAVGMTVIACTLAGVRFSGWFGEWIWPLAARGAFATALFAAVMYAGAIPKGTAPVKRLMPIRAQLSILASILTLGHNIAYGKTYFVMLFTRPSRMPWNQLAAAICSLVMICVMLPLFVTSFPAVRRRMAPKKWKKLQRWAYLFYGLIYIHVMLLMLPAAHRGGRGYLFSAALYSAVFLTYGALRAAKALAGRKALRWIPAAAGALIFTLAMSYGLGPAAPKATEAGMPVLSQQESPAPPADETPRAAVPDEGPSAAPQGVEAPEGPEEEESLPEETPAQPPEEQAPIEETTASEEQTPPEEPPAPPEAPADPAPPAPPQEREAPPEEPSAPPTEPAPPAPAPVEEAPAALQYQEGTFTGTGMGFSGPVTVSITLRGDVIEEITVVAAADEEPYWTDALAVVQRVMAAQSTQVDTVTGATYSSAGLLEAIEKALASARN